MNAQTSDISINDQLDSIEGRVQRLLDLLEKLSAENDHLKKREHALTQECADLRRRHEIASIQLEAMINRIKYPRQSGFDNL